MNLEKKNHVKKHIRIIIYIYYLLISGAATTDPYQIRSEQKDLLQFVQNKAVDTDSIKYFLNNLGIPQLSEEQKLSCEGQITIEECKGILETFENNKSPGNDGIPSEFYKNC